MFSHSHKILSILNVLLNYVSNRKFVEGNVHRGCTYEQILKYCFKLKLSYIYGSEAQNCHIDLVIQNVFVLPYYLITVLLFLSFFFFRVPTGLFLILTQRAVNENPLQKAVRIRADYMLDYQQKV